MTVHDSTRSPPWAEGNGATVRVTSSSRARHIVVAKTRSRAESRAESHAKRAVFTLRAIDMNAEECERCLRAIRAHRPDMKQFLEPELEIDYARVLGEGGFATAYLARFRGEKVCARVVDSNKESAVVAEVATVSDLPRVAVKTHGCAATTKPSDGKKYLAVVSELCEEGCLEDFMVRERALGRDLSERVRLDVFLQVAEGLEELKAARVVWRDLKAKNVLVRSVVRNSFGTVTKMTIGFTDWGTAVRLPKIGKRRMTLQGPGTCGYIAPETRGPHYDFQADMWAFLVWTASMCLDVEVLVDCQLEEALGELKLEKKLAATAGQETRVKEILAKFDDRVAPGCRDMYDFLKNTKWVDANDRWSSDEAIEELVDFRAAHDLHLPMGGCTPARPTAYPEESVMRTDVDDNEAVERGDEVEQKSPMSVHALTPGPFAMTPYAPTPFAMTPAIDSCTPGPRWHPLMNRRLVELPPPMQLQHARDPEEDMPPPAEKTPAPVPVVAVAEPAPAIVTAPRSPLRALDANARRPEEESAQPQKKRRGRPPKVRDCPPPTAEDDAAAGSDVNNSMALVVVSQKGCSKCRWSRNGCGACDPETPRLPRGPAAAKKKRAEASRASSRATRSRATSVSTSTCTALALVPSKGCSKCRWSAGGCGKCDPETPRLPRGLAARKTTKTKTKAVKSKKSAPAVDNSMALVLVSDKGCSKCRWSRNGCGACDPETPRLPRGPAAAKKKRALAVKETTTTKRQASTRVKTKSSKGTNVKFPTKSSKYVDVNTGEIVKELTLVPVRRADGSRGRGRPRVLRPPRTDLGCSKCRYAVKGCGKCREELEEARALSRRSARV